MRRLLFGVFAASFLVGMLTGCQTTHPIADSTACSSPCATGTCGSSCGSSSCASGGCSSCGQIRGLGLICHTAGVCDCDRDEDPCAHRAPWASRAASYPTIAGGVQAAGFVQSNPVPVTTSATPTLPTTPTALAPAP